MDRIDELHALGQSCWMDDLTRDMLASGELARRVAAEGLRGVTSNPAIFEQAIAADGITAGAYESAIAQAAAAGNTAEQIYTELTTSDVRSACDVLRPVFEATHGVDGFVSLEVSPHLARDTQGSIEEGRRLWAIVQRPNLFIKIPGTAEGVPAVEQLVFEGININVTLLFSVDSYEAVARAYLRGLERRLEASKRANDVTSVASFFLSRIDVLVDQLLVQRVASDVAARGSPGPPDARALLGKAAVANAKLAYQRLLSLQRSDRWQAVARQGAQVQRLLWASTSTKNPAYPDLLYVEPLIGALTVNTMPPKTIAAFRDHGVVRRTIDEGVEDAQRVMHDLERLGIKFDLCAAQLENEGIQKFISPYDLLLQQLAEKRERYVGVAPPDRRQVGR